MSEPPRAAGDPAAEKIDVYEVVDEARRESLIVFSLSAREALSARLAARPPPISHWPAGDELRLDLLAGGMPRVDALEFAARFLRSVRSVNWTTLIAEL